MSKNIIEVTPETERRHMQRRASESDFNLELVLSNIGLELQETRKSLPDAKERRRHAVLQAAAAMQPELERYGVGREGCVDIAEALLAEIEKREAGE